LTGSTDNFDPLREYLGANSLSQREKFVWPSLTRRNFLIRCCQGASAGLFPATLRNLAFAFDSRNALALESEFHLHPHYRAKLVLEATLLKTQAGFDNFVTEKYANEIAAILAQWNAGLLRSPQDIQAIEGVLAPDFSGTSLQSVESRLARSGPVLEIQPIRAGAEPRECAILRLCEFGFCFPLSSGYSAPGTTGTSVRPMTSSMRSVCANSALSHLSPVTTVMPRTSVCGDWINSRIDC